MILLICGILKKDANEFIYKTETDSENKRGHQVRRVGEGKMGSFGFEMYTLLHLKWITNKDLLYSIGNLANIL